MSTVGNVNVIGSETYIKNYPVERRWDLDISEEQAEKIANGCRSDCINIRHVQGKLIKTETEEIYLGDNLGRVAEALSGGRIQLQQHESGKPLAETRSWTPIPTKEAKGWKEIYVTYVYQGETPSSQLRQQADKNPTRVLFHAGVIHLGQYVGLTQNLRLVIGDQLDEVVKYIRGEPVKEI
ncbi:MAG: hypothetical protein ACRDFB_01400 [Rhabdochlamydiaceae bacterium]